MNTSPETTPREVAIRTEALDCGYGDHVVLADVNVTLPAGKVTCILGTSGCGKSTLLRNLLRLEKPMAGRILVEGENVAEFEGAELAAFRRRTGVLFQSGALFAGASLLENTAFPLLRRRILSPADCREIALRKLDLVGLARFADHQPAQVSGGMRKRAGIARALALDPPYLFLDEPSAGLDPVTAQELDATILDLKEALGTTFVVITHELLSIRRIADWLVMLGEGGVLAEGRLGELERHAHDKVRAFFAVGRPTEPRDTAAE